MKCLVLCWFLDVNDHRCCVLMKCRWIIRPVRCPCTTRHIRVWWHWCRRLSRHNSQSVGHRRSPVDQPVLLNITWLFRMLEHSSIHFTLVCHHRWSYQVSHSQASRHPQSVHISMSRPTQYQVIPYIAVCCVMLLMLCWPWRLSDRSDTCPGWMA